MEIPKFRRLREGLKQRVAHGGKPDLKGRAQKLLEIKSQCTDF